MRQKNFVGVIFGGDMNSYAVARAFYEAYKIKTIVLGKHPIYPTLYSKLIEGYYDENILKEENMIAMLKKIDEKYPDKKKIVLSNADYYVRQVIHLKEKIKNISNNFIIPTIDEELFNQLFNKSSFYEMCDKFNLPYPKTVVFDFKKDKLSKFDIPFTYPLFAKPSNSDIYARLDFEGKQKGYKIKNKHQLETILKTIKNSGYNDKLIIQEYIESTDDDMYVYTFYANKKHKVQVMTAGKILMHDRTPELIGNYNAITNAYNEKLSIELKDFVEKIKYTGIGHFDVVFDRLRKKYVVLEINIRQGRSNLYTLASGVNLMEYLVDDYINNINKEFKIASKKFVVSVVSKRMLKKCVKNVRVDNHYRFALAPYDINLRRLKCQKIWDKKIIDGFKKYNKEEK